MTAKVKDIGVRLTFDGSKFMASLKRMGAAMEQMAKAARRGRRELVGMAAWFPMALAIASMQGQLLSAKFLDVRVKLPWWRWIQQWRHAEDLQALTDAVPKEVMSIEITYGWPKGWWRLNYWRHVLRWRHPLHYFGHDAWLEMDR